MKKTNRRQAGVTLIEMMVVVVIIALFAALVLPRMMGQADKARKTAARAQINAFMTALASYKLDTSSYPTTEQGLQALRVKPENVNNWQGPYTDKEIDNDPWGHPYVYHVPGREKSAYDLYTLGPNGNATGPPEDAQR